MKLTAALIALGFVLSCGCASYSGITTVGKNKVVVLKNDGLLFGLLRSAQLCTVTKAGLSNCVEKDQP